ncbi:MAG: heavy-metal-associated domain-containing protein [Cellulomonadaceae bacterium]|nr:heavy-metal-associated domain-containing protein [Cellulomonadaceae bacterium]
MLNDTPRTFVGATTFHVNGMTCWRCHDAVADHIRRLPGVVEVGIDAVTGTVTVTAQTPVDRVDVAQAVKTAGYELRP